MKPTSDQQSTSLEAVNLPDMPTFLQKNGDRTVTYRALNAVLDGVLDEMLDLMVELRKRADSVDARVAAIAGKPHVKFCGVWKDGTDYTTGDAATHQGGLWICKASPAGRPGEDFDGWQLAVKSRSL